MGAGRRESRSGLECAVPAAVQTPLGWQHPASPSRGGWLGCNRADPVLKVAQTPSRESQGTHWAGSKNIAWEMVACDPAPHPASGTANPHGQRAHACVCVCGTLGRRMLQRLFAGGHRGASVPAELPLASVSLTNGVCFGGRALMKAVPAAGAGRGAPAQRTLWRRKEKKRTKGHWTRPLAMTRWLPCGTHVLLPGPGHLALCSSQPCKTGSWATGRRRIADGGEGLGVPFSLFSGCEKVLAGAQGQAGAGWVLWGRAAPELEGSELEALPAHSTGCHRPELRVLGCSGMMLSQQGQDTGCPWLDRRTRSVMQHQQLQA